MTSLLLASLFYSVQKLGSVCYQKTDFTKSTLGNQAFMSKLTTLKLPVLLAVLPRFSLALCLKQLTY